MKNGKPISNSTQPSLLVITGGGTGGHLYPALAVVEALQQRQPPADLLFIGRDAGRDGEEAAKRDISFMGLPLMGLRRRLSLQNVKAIYLFVRGVLQARKTMKTYKDGMVFGVGGYVAAPAMIAGKWLRWPVTLHEQNTIPGLVNRTLARWCNRVFITFDKTRDYLKNVPCTTTGFPVRQSLVDASQQAQSINAHQTECPTILVIGGSQGAKKLVETAHEAFSLLEQQDIPFQAMVQTGERNIEMARQLDWPSPVDVVAYIDDMAQAYERADVVVSRAGAGSLAEIALWGLPAILVPFPYASENHQEENARVWEDQGAAMVMKDQNITGESLCHVLKGLLNDPERRNEMHGRAASLARHDAARHVADELIRLFEERS